MKNSSRGRKTARVFRTKEERQRLMDEYSRSGETRKDYCRRKNLSIHTFNNWWQKRMEKDLDFAEVALPQHGKSRNATAIITFPNGITVKIKAEENLSVTAQLIREVIGC